MRKQIFIELIWLAGVCFLTVSVIFLLSRLQFSIVKVGFTGISISLHDTYFVFYPAFLYQSLIAIWLVIIYGLKELRHGYKRTIPNAILSLGLFILISTLFYIHPFVSLYSYTDQTSPSIVLKGQELLKDTSNGFNIFMKFVHPAVYWGNAILSFLSGILIYRAYLTYKLSHANPK